MSEEDSAKAALERLLAAAEERLPTGDDDAGEPRFGLLSARFVADECRKGLGPKFPPAGKVKP
jgi:hypothetical protein